ncbi:hypothetical protein BJY00DRAFT_206151 [Aspergillus carlsbadensis]|nr:hypothetical protein BJY00DRAFT_206151 [Aspergillus carlsbadensis]
MPNYPSDTSNLNPRTFTSLSTSNISLPITIHPATLFHGPSLITLVTNPAYLPITLTPTEPQMQAVHATWVNSLPFPRMRKNLPHPLQGVFRSFGGEFLVDLVGDFVDTGRFFRGPRAVSVFAGGDDEDTSDSTFNLRGAIKIENG